MLLGGSTRGRPQTTGQVAAIQDPDERQERQGRGDEPRAPRLQGSGRGPRGEDTDKKRARRAEARARKAEEENKALKARLGATEKNTSGDVGECLKTLADPKYHAMDLLQALMTLEWEADSQRGEAVVLRQQLKVEEEKAEVLSTNFKQVQQVMQSLRGRVEAADREKEQAGTSHQAEQKRAVAREQELQAQVQAVE